MTSLVVNGDDLGLHPRIDDGILRAHREGILSSATVLVTGAHAETAVQKARAQGLPLGLHLCLSTRLPPALPPGEVPSLQVEGRFRKSWAQVALTAARGKLNLAEVAREFRAQLRLARSLGFEPDHLDSHQHLHLLPGIRRVVCDLSKKERLPVRWPREWHVSRAFRAPLPWMKASVLSTLAALPGERPFRAVAAQGILDSGQLTEQRLLAFLDSLPDGEHELVSHPGETPERVVEDEGWRYHWEEELFALTSPKARQKLSERGIRLCSYGQLSTHAG